MIAIGIDPSTHTGIACASGYKQVLHSAEFHSKTLNGFPRVEYLVGEVWRVIEEFSPNVICIESLFVGHSSSAITLIEIGTVLRYMLWQQGIPYIDVPATTLKKFVAGSGAAKKEQMILNVFKQWGATAATNNIADAIGLAMFGLAMNGVSFGAQRDSVAKSLHQK